MRRSILATAIVIIIGLGSASGLAAVRSPEVPVTIRAGQTDPIELDRMIRAGEAALVEEASHLNHTSLGSLYLIRARLFSSATDYERAVELLETADRVDPDPATATQLGQALVAVHEFAAALEAVASVPEESDYATTTAGIEFDSLMGLGREEEASARLNRLLETFPDEPAILVRAAALASVEGEGERSRDVSASAAERAQGLTGREKAFYETVAGRYAFAVGDLDVARRELMEAVEDDPFSAGGWLTLARVHAARGNLTEAVEAAERAAALVPEPEALGFLADLYTLSGQPAQAEAQLATVDAIADLGRPVYRRAVLTTWLDHGRRPYESLLLAREEVRARPDHMGHLLLARALMTNGHIQEAAAEADMSVGPADPSIWFHAGVVALAAGDAPTASERFERAARLNPDFHPIFSKDLRLERNAP